MLKNVSQVQDERWSAAKWYEVKLLFEGKRRSFVEGKSMCFPLKILLLIIHLSNVHVSLNNERPLCHQYLLLFHPENPKWQTGISVAVFCSVFVYLLWLGFVSYMFHFRKAVQDVFKILISRGILIYVFCIFAQAHSKRGKMLLGFQDLIA